MIDNYRYFITLAEELSISRAAEKLFVSHQSLSAYIKRLEYTYQTPLFYRKPNLALTPAGEVLLDAVRRIQAIQVAVHDELDELRNELRGKFVFGTTPGRYRILVPKLLTRFKKLYPNIQIVVVDDITENLALKAVNGEIDLILGGYDRMNIPMLTTEIIMSETIYLVASDHLLQTYFPSQYPDIKKTFSREGVDFHLFERIPFVVASQGSASRQSIDRFLLKNNYRINIEQESSQQDIHHQLSRIDDIASFCLQMYVPNALDYNRSTKEGSALNVYTIQGFTDQNRVAVAYHRDSYLSQYKKDFIKIIKDICQEDFSHIGSETASGRDA